MDKGQLAELIIAWLARIPMLPFRILFSITGLVVGAFLVINPHLSIEIQRRFYYRINWKIEPVSLSKEIHNTRAMGWFLFIFSAIILFFSLHHGPR